MARRETPDLGGPVRGALVLSLVCIFGGVALWSVTGDGVFLVRGAQFAIGLLFLWPLASLFSLGDDSRHAEWSTLDGDDRLARTGATTALPADDATPSVYETQVDDRPVTVRLVGGTSGGDGAPVTTVETPLRTVRRGAGLTVDDPAALDGVDWLSDADGVRNGLPADARLTVDDSLGVVRCEVGGVVGDADRLTGVARAVAGVADAVERRDRESDRSRTVERA